ncbi:MAG: MaoC/PaaZ C-terminal domain-containing protein [Bradymonadaceae bacterium]
MSVSKRFVLEHRAPISGLARLVARSARTALRGGEQTDPDLTTSERFEKTIDPPDRGLVREYVRAMGGEPDTYRGLVPPHLFPQWSFDLAGRTLAHLPLSFIDMVNGGCRMEARAPLPGTCQLEVSGQLIDVRRDGRKIRFDQKFTTGPSGAPEALVAHMYTVLVRSRGDEPEDDGGASGGPPTVPDGAREVRRWSLPEDAGWEFAMLTGDFNPLHWFPPAARAVGFDAPILHGFATMARSWEALAGEFEAATPPLGTFDVRFTHPLELPAEAGLYVESEDDGQSGRLSVGADPGAPANMVGDFDLHTVSEHTRDDE